MLIRALLFFFFFFLVAFKGYTTDPSQLNSWKVKRPAVPERLKVSTRPTLNRPSYSTSASFSFNIRQTCFTLDRYTMAYWFNKRLINLKDWECSCTLSLHLSLSLSLSPALSFSCRRFKFFLFVLADKALKGWGLRIFEQMTEHISFALYADIGPLCR